MNRPGIHNGDFPRIGHGVIISPLKSINRTSLIAMKLQNIKKLAVIAAIMAPATAFAQYQITDISSLTTKFTSIETTVVSVLISLAVIFIVWHAVKFIMTNAPDKRQEEGKSILWGIVGLFIILSIWGLVAILGNSLNTGPNQAPVNQFPQINNYVTTP